MASILKTFYALRKRPAPYYAQYPLRLLLWKPLRKFINVVVIPNMPFNCLRVFSYRLIGYRIGRNVFIGMRCYLDDIEPKKTVIEDNVIISYGCFFAAHGRGQDHTDILVMEGAYLGMRVNVVSGKSGVSIGRHSIVGAAALVAESIPDDCTALGVPARVVKHHGGERHGDSGPRWLRD
jgi:acetyltransferase-like isoleucine patch superfamily enzyme